MNFVYLVLCARLSCLFTQIVINMNDVHVKTVRNLAPVDLDESATWQYEFILTLERH